MIELLDPETLIDLESSPAADTLPYLLRVLPPVR